VEEESPRVSPFGGDAVRDAGDVEAMEEAEEASLSISSKSIPGDRGGEETAEEGGSGRVRRHETHCTEVTRG